MVDGSKCISYFTIELKDEIPETVKGKFENWIFGCDICQDVCPWNRFAKPHQENEFLPVDDLFHMDQKKWKELKEISYSKLFKGSAIKRSNFKGLTRNIRFVSDAN